MSKKYLLLIIAIFLASPMKAHAGDSTESLAYLIPIFILLGAAFIGFILGLIVVTKIRVRQYKNNRKMLSRMGKSLIIVSIVLLFAVPASLYSYNLYKEIDLSFQEKYGPEYRQHSKLMSKAESIFTSEAELEKLYHDAVKENDDGVLLFLAQNSKSPSWMLKEMSEVPYCSVKVFVAQHKNTPMESVVKLSKDENSYVRAAALRRLEE